jgi:hypothetical protein
VTKDTVRPTLNDEEWDLVTELLEREERELPTEIHHTDSSEYREKLRHRLALLTNLLERMRQTAS